MNRRKSFAGFLSVVIMAMALAAGCQPKTAGLPQASDSTNSQDTEVQTTMTDPRHPFRGGGAVNPVTPPAAPSAANDKVSLAGSDSGANHDLGSKTGKPKIQIDSPYTQAKPTLLGLTLKTDATSILNRFGKPKDDFLMDEDADPIQVYDYGDFLIGFNQKKELQFIEVRTREVDPGLNGLRLGDPASAVSKALGKPAASSNYVITYKAAGAILKLDIDPKTQQIHSIKLFAE